MGIFHFGDWNEFTEVSYIESTGTQLLDTDYIMTPNSKVIVTQKFNLLTAQSIILDTDMSDTNYGSYQAYINGAGYLAYSCNDGRGSYTSTYVLPDTAIHTYEYDVKNKTYKVDNGQYLDVLMVGNITKNSKHTLSLLGKHDDNGFSTVTSANLYGCIIEEDGIIKRNLKPCYHTATGIIGMFDMVNNKFYTNVGTGTFIKGPDVN